MKHCGTVRIETERLILRPFTEADGDAMYRNWAADPEVTRYLTWQPHESAEQSRMLAKLWEDASARDPSVYQWAIELKSLGEPIGSLSVVRLDEALSIAELGYCIGRAWWGQGLMPEAVRAVIDCLIRRVGANRVRACHDVNNPNSGRVMAKAGMKREGTLRQAGRNSSSACVDLTCYSILAEEYAPPGGKD